MTGRGSCTGAVWVCIPTYNEADSVEGLTRMLLSVFDDRDVDGRVLVIDDSSPDGTADILARLSSEDSHRVSSSSPKGESNFRQGVVSRGILREVVTGKSSSSTPGIPRACSGGIGPDLAQMPLIRSPAPQHLSPGSRTFPVRK